MVMEQCHTESGGSSKASSIQEGKFDLAGVLTLAAAHMGHDTYTAFLAPLLPLLIAKLSIPIAAAGVLSAIFRAGSLAQPLLGAWADRTDTRYFVILAPTITALGMSLLGLAPSYMAVVALLAVAGLSHGAFHPASAATVTRISGRTWGKGSSIYMAGGKLGFTIGPLFIASVVTWQGLEASWIAAIPGILVSLLLYRILKDRRVTPVRQANNPSIWKEIKEQKRSLLLLSGFVLFRSTAFISFSTFYPTFLSELGFTVLFAGFAMTLYQLGGAMGALMGGFLSDIGGRRLMLVISQLLAGPLLFMALQRPGDAEGMLLLVLGGAMISAATPIQLILFQQLMPANRSTAAGIWSLLSFEGSVATVILIGVIADLYGLGAALGLSVLASMLSIPFILAVPEPKGVG